MRKHRIAIASLVEERYSIITSKWSSGNDTISSDIDSHAYGIHAIRYRYRTDPDRDLDCSTSRYSLSTIPPYSSILFPFLLCIHCFLFSLSVRFDIGRSYAACILEPVQPR